MKKRWLAAGISAVLITGAAATFAQRVITQKTRGVLPAVSDVIQGEARLPVDATIKFGDSPPKSSGSLLGTTALLSNATPEPPLLPVEAAEV